MSEKDYYSTLGSVYAERKALREKAKKQTKQRDAINAKDLVICIYDEDKIGLFKKVQWVGKVVRDEWTGFNSYDAGIIYVGLDTKLIGMKRTHYSVFSDDAYLEAGSECSLLDGNHYVSNCEIRDEFSFNDVRLEMFYNETISKFNIHDVSNEDVVKVLEYAKDNYQRQHTFVKKRIKEEI